jgi:predicted nucleic acid-binding Zn ribbon protein
MRKSSVQPLKDVLREYINALGHRRKLKEVSIIAQWEKLMGKTVATHTTRLFIRKRILFVQLNSSILRNELFMQRDKIVQHLNEASGENIIDKIIFQ